MTNTQHTPGPWKLLSPEEGSHLEVQFSQNDDVDWLDYARVYGADKQANARLIAAAPELLEALRAVLNGGSTGIMALEARRMAEAAIAKATGV